MKNDIDEELIRARERGYEILCAPDAGEMLTLFGKLVADVSPQEKEGDSVCRDGVRRTLFHDGRCRCWLVEYGGKKYILKLDKRDRHRFDYLVQSFFLGSNAFRLLKTLHRAAKRGVKGLPVRICALQCCRTAARRSPTGRSGSSSPDVP